MHPTDEQVLRDYDEALKHRDRLCVIFWLALLASMFCLGHGVATHGRDDFILTGLLGVLAAASYVNARHVLSTLANVLEDAVAREEARRDEEDT